jgi:hypothetical protein
MRLPKSLESSQVLIAMQYMTGGLSLATFFSLSDENLSGNLAISGALEMIAIWNLRQAQQVRFIFSSFNSLINFKISTLGPSNPNYPYHTLGNVTFLVCSGDRSTLAAG